MQTNQSKSVKPRSIKANTNALYYPLPISNLVPSGNFVNSDEPSMSQGDIDSQAQPTFQTKNKVYQLNSRYNELQYYITKKNMDFQIKQSQFRQKNAYLQQLAASLSQQIQGLTKERDHLRDSLGEVWEKYNSQVEIFKYLKQQFQLLQQRTNQTAKNTNQSVLRRISSIESKEELQQSLNHYQSKASLKSNKIQVSKLEKQQLETEKFVISSQLSLSNSKLQALERQIKARKTQLQQKDQAFMGQIKAKEQELSLLRQQKLQQSLQVGSVKDQYFLKQKRTVQIHTEQIKRINEILQGKEEIIRTLQNQKAAMENKFNEQSMELSRMKCQKAGLEQYNKYLQGSNSENEEKRKNMQDEIYRYEKEASDLRSQIFNLKIQNKKNLNTYKLEFEEEKLKFAEEIQEKSARLKELTYSSNRKNEVEMSQSHHNFAQELEKSAQQITALKTENQNLNACIKSLEEKYNKKSEKYNQLQKSVRNQYEDRIKALETQLYRLQMENSQFQPKVEKKQREKQIKPNNMLFDTGSEGDEHLSDLVQLLKMEKLQKEEKINELAEKYRDCQSKLSSQKDRNSRLQLQLRQAKETQYRQSYEKQMAKDRIITLNELNQEIRRLSDELRKERENSDQSKRQLKRLLQKHCQQLDRLRQQNDKQRTQCNFTVKRNRQLEIKNQRLSQELEQRKMNCQTMQSQISNITKQMQDLRNKEIIMRQKSSSIVILENKLQELLRQVETAKIKQKGLQQSKNSLQKQLQFQKKLTESNRKLQDPLKQRLDNLEKQNYSIKLDYSQALQQVNTLLVKYQTLEDKHKKLITSSDRLKDQISNYSSARIKSEECQRETEEYKRIIARNESQITRLNVHLMQKQMQIKQLLASSYHHKLSPHSKQCKKTKETDLWLTGINQSYQNVNISKYKKEQKVDSSINRYSRNISKI